MHGSRWEELKKMHQDFKLHSMEETEEVNVQEFHGIYKRKKNSHELSKKDGGTL